MRNLKFGPFDGFRRSNGVFPLVQYFSAVSAIAILAFAFVAFFSLREFTKENIVGVAERQNLILARTFQKSIWPRFADYIILVNFTS